MLVSRCHREAIDVEQDWYVCTKCWLPTNPIISLSLEMDYCSNNDYDNNIAEESINE